MAKKKSTQRTSLGYLFAHEHVKAFLTSYETNLMKKKTEFFPFLSLVFKWDKASIVNECEQRFRRPPTWNSNSKIPCHNAGIWEISVNCHSENNSLFLHCQYGTPPTRPTPPRRPKLYIFICHVPMPEFIFLCICMCTGRWNCYFLFFFVCSIGIPHCPLT